MSSTECCAILLRGRNAFTASLGGAVVASGDIYAAAYNPAFSVNPQPMVMVDVTKTEVVNTTSAQAAFRVKQFPLLVRLTLWDYGTEESTNEENEKTGSLWLNTEELSVASAAEFSGGRVRLGAAYTIYAENRTCTGYCRNLDGSSVSFMAGAGVAVKLNQLRIGASLVNAGTKLQANNAEQADPTPTRLRVGVAHALSWRVSETDSVRLTVEGDVAARGISAFAAGGSLDLVMDEVLSVRCGWMSSGDGVNFGTTGIGVGLNLTKIRVDVGKTLAVDESESPFSLGIRIKL